VLSSHLALAHRTQSCSLWLTCTPHTDNPARDEREAKSESKEKAADKKKREKQRSGKAADGELVCLVHARLGSRKASTMVRRAAPSLWRASVTSDLPACALCRWRRRTACGSSSSSV
jgi:hypothetical protein